MTLHPVPADRALLKIRPLAVALATVFATAGALADAADPQAVTQAVSVQNNDGTVTMTVSGTWFWAGQNCTARYGVAWAVDWWGVSTLASPAPSFALTDATMVPKFGQTTHGTITPTGRLHISDGTYFHVASTYGGEDVFGPGTCAVVQVDGVSGSTGSWSATATYPNAAVIPTKLCVNMYDLHGKAGRPGGPKDLSPTGDADNSIQTNAYVPGNEVRPAGVSPYTIGGPGGGSGYTFCAPH